MPLANEAGIMALRICLFACGGFAFGKCKEANPPPPINVAGGFAFGKCAANEAGIMALRICLRPPPHQCGLANVALRICLRRRGESPLQCGLDCVLPLLPAVARNVATFAKGESPPTM